MKIVEILNGIALPVTNEEASLLNKIDKSSGTVKKSSLSEREQLLANGLVIKSVLARVKDGGVLVYKKI